jgi:hypothetical protein
MVPPHDDMVLNILAFYAEATPTERREGMAWYPTARQFARNVADGYGIATETVVAVIAALSPQKEWTANCAWAVSVIDAYHRGLPLPRLGLGNSLRRAERALAGDMADILRDNGTLKVRNFYGSILGERGAVCVDRHAIRVAHGNAHAPESGGINKGEYLAVADAYRAAGRELGRSFAGVQAVTWTVCQRLRSRGAVAA